PTLSLPTEGEGTVAARQAPHPGREYSASSVESLAARLLAFQLGPEALAAAAEVGGGVPVVPAVEAVEGPLHRQEGGGQIAGAVLVVYRQRAQGAAVPGARGLLPERGGRAVVARALGAGRQPQERRHAHRVRAVAGRHPAVLLVRPLVHLRALEHPPQAIDVP